MPKYVDDAVKEIYETAQEDPSEVDLDELLGYLETESATQRTTVLRAVTLVAQEDSDRVEERIDELRPSLEDDVVTPRTAAAYVFDFLAEEHPESVLPSMDQLVDMLDQEPPLLRYRAAGALIPLLAEYPEEFVEYTEELADVLANGPEVEIPDPDDPEIPDEMREQVVQILDQRGEQFEDDKARSQGVFEFAANALVEVAEREPEAVAPHVEQIQEKADHERPIVRTAVLDTLATVAEHDAEAVGPVVDVLRERLGDDEEYVRAHAVRALGYANATEAVDDLRELADDEDAEDDLRELADDTADWLEEQRAA